MGRNKIPIKFINNSDTCYRTFKNREVGIIKKAMKLSILCDCKVSVTIEMKYKRKHNLVIYSSDSYKNIINEFENHCNSYKLYLNNTTNNKITTNMIKNNFKIIQK